MYLVSVTIEDNQHEHKGYALSSHFLPDKEIDEYFNYDSTTRVIDISFSPITQEEKETLERLGIASFIR